MHDCMEYNGGTILTAEGRGGREVRGREEGREKERRERKGRGREGGRREGEGEGGREGVDDEETCLKRT